MDAKASSSPGRFRLFAIGLPACALFFLAAPGARPAAHASTEGVRFSSEIRPLLSRKCFPCHGPDATHRQAELRLDGEEWAHQKAIVGGRPDESPLYRRIVSADPDERMPPPEAGEPLSAEEAALLRAWIAGGGNYTAHWSYAPPERPPVPDVGSSDWVRNPIDAFVLARLQQEGLSPSPTAERTQLLRRLYLDVIGLPPTLAEADAYLAGDEVGEGNDARYRALVETLLSSKHFGERWARPWLDAARYSDSDGFEKDKPREVWMYRDWVVGALNRDLPYDQFLIEQVAGDLLPHATQDQIVATGFLRNSMLNEEGGIDPEQFRMEAMFDRMDAIGKGILGITLGCGQCHDHKYEALSQKDYYRLFAFVNNSHEGSAEVFPADEQEATEKVRRQIEWIEGQLQRAAPDWRERIAVWAQSLPEQPAWSVLELHSTDDNSQRYDRLNDGSLRAGGYAPTQWEANFEGHANLPSLNAVRLELLTDDNLPCGGPGRAINGLCALTELRLSVVGADAQSTPIRLTSASADFGNAPHKLAARYYAVDAQGTTRTTGPVEFAIDDDVETAWGIDQGPRRRNQSRKAVFVAERATPLPPGARLKIQLVQMHGGWNSDDYQTMNLGRFRLSATSAAQPVADPLPVGVRRLVDRFRADAHVAATLSNEEWQTLFSYWRTTVAEWEAANELIELAWGKHPSGTTQLVLKERDEPRPTYLLERGDFLKPLEAVAPGVPRFLHALDPSLGQPSGQNAPPRLAFARWLADRRSPTTARSFVNRVWQEYFGVGLVETSEDLGVQGALPTHPELLDWMAVEFMEQGWSVRWLHRTILNSATYRQSSRATSELLARDPANRLLARGPRKRLPAELVRDVHLASSGLLEGTLGGPGSYPPAPEFLFRPPASYGPKWWPGDASAHPYRRGLYTFRFRTAIHPALDVFDAPAGDASCPRRGRSNTPLQALATLNEPLSLACARALARNALVEAQGDVPARVEWVVRRCLTRRPTEQERQRLVALWQLAEKQFAAPDREAAAWSLATSNAADRSSLPDGTRPAELAAWTTVCRVALNLDETITSE